MKLKPLFAASALVVMAACTSNNVSNPELLTTRTESGTNVVQHLANLDEGTSRASILALLQRIDSDPFGSLVEVTRSTSAIQEALYGGNIEIHGSPQEMEAFRRSMEGYEVWTIPFQNVNNQWRFAGLTYNEKKTGVEGEIVLVFNQSGVLAADAKPEVRAVNKTEKEAIVPKLLKEGLDSLMP